MNIFARFIGTKLPSLGDLEVDHVLVAPLPLFEQCSSALRTLLRL